MRTTSFQPRRPDRTTHRDKRETEDRDRVRTTNRSGPSPPEDWARPMLVGPPPSRADVRDPPVRPPERDRRRRRPSVSPTVLIPLVPVPPNGHQQEDFGAFPERRRRLSGRYEPGRPEFAWRSPTPSRTRGSCFVDPAALQLRNRALREPFGPYRPRQRKLWRTNLGGRSSTSKGWLRSRSKVGRGICGGS